MHKAFLDEVLKEAHRQGEAERVKPIITLSRSFGCGAVPVAERLAEAMNVRERMRGKRVRWQWIAKDLFDQLAEGTDSPLRRSAAKWPLDQLHLLAERETPPEPHALEAVRNFVGAVADKGYFIIVGMAGESILAGRANTLSLRLDAPLEWRTRELYHKGMARTLKSAREMARLCDVQREAFRSVFQERDPGPLWHLRFDRSRIPTGIIVDTALHLSESLGIR